MKQKDNYQYNDKFYDAGWDKWQDMKRFGPASLHLRRLVLGVIKNLAVNSIIDVGCGEGSLLKEIKKIKNALLNGVDFSRVALKKAKENMPHGSFAILDITDSSNQYFNSKNKFDLVIAADIIEHINNDCAVIKNLKRLSNKYILISTLQGNMRDTEKKMGHVRSYRKNELEEKLKKEKIKIIKKIEWGFPFYSPLYRSLLNMGDFTGITTGKYGLLRILAARLLWLLFYLNLTFSGDYLILLGEISEPKTFQK